MAGFVMPVLAAGAGKRTGPRPVPPGPARGEADVRKYGAVGDGVTDDTPAFEAALTSGGRGIYVPPGKYLLTTVVLPPGFSVRAFGVTFVKRGLGPMFDFRGENMVRVAGGFWTSECPESTEVIADLLRDAERLKHAMGASGAG